MERPRDPIALERCGSARVTPSPAADRGDAGRPGAIVRHRRAIIVAAHLALIALSNYVAFLLRFDGLIPPSAMSALVETLPWLVAVRAVTFIPFRLYRGIWRYTGVWDLRNIVVGTVLSSAIFVVVFPLWLGPANYPESVLMIDTILLIVLISGMRLSRRVVRELAPLERHKRVLVYGAGDAGEMIVRDMRNNVMFRYRPVGFVDDNPGKHGQQIHGLRVLGGLDDLPRVIRRVRPDVILIAMPSVSPARIRQLVTALTPYKIPIQTLPSLRDILDNTVEVRQIRDLSVEDLLDRAPVSPAPDRIRHLIEGRRVMVTGAGGSIGSELARQIAALGPDALVLYERYENGLYTIATELEATSPPNVVRAIIGDVTDVNQVNAVIGECRPHVVFHAAAHKHVPLMEINPCEAVKNNVTGTRIVAEAAAHHGVGRFVLISSDKAVNPSSVMGATKRLAELLVQTVDASNPGIFASVRFGNVLASSGSVVPRFLEQIRMGGPVTVTHPDMRRYFMLIREAVHLVLHAAALARGAEVFVLEMGEPVKIVDMARNLIRLAGFVPDEEIPITFVGLRPGEKLSEELLGEDESMEPSEAPEILRVQAAWRPGVRRLRAQVADLEGRAASGDAKGVIESLKETIPTYRPWDPDPTNDH